MHSRRLSFFIRLLTLIVLLLPSGSVLSAQTQDIQPIFLPMLAHHLVIRPPVVEIHFDHKTPDGEFADTSGFGHSARCTFWKFCAMQVPGKVGQAIQLDQSLALSIYGERLAVDATEDFAVAAWISFGSRCTTCKAVSQASELVLERNETNTTLSFTAGFFPETKTTINAPISDDEWHYVVVVLSRSEARIRLYVDGVEGVYITQPSIAGLGALPENYFYLGADNFDQQIHMMDEFVMYKAALTPDEIRSNYNRINGSRP